MARPVTSEVLKMVNEDYFEMAIMRNLDLVIENLDESEYIRSKIVEHKESVADVVKRNLPAGVEVHDLYPPINELVKGIVQLYIFGCTFRCLDEDQDIPAYYCLNTDSCPYEAQNKE